MKKLFASLFVVALVTGCQQLSQQTTQGSNDEELGNCNLGAKSGGSTSTTEAECKDLGGKFTD